MDDFLTSQWATPIDFGELKDIIPPEDIFIFSIDEELVDSVDAEIIKIRIVLTLSEIKTLIHEKYILDPGNLNYLHIEAIKSDVVLSRIVELTHLIAEQYREIIGKDDTDNYKQLIEIPIVYKDLCPGDTCIQFDVYTKRKLVHK